MGSHLEVGDDEVWLRYLALLTGGIGELHVDAADVKPVSPGRRRLSELCKHLQQSHIVIPFAYDWRKSIANAADLLASEVERQLERTKQPVRFIAHSMGGLVVRAMIASRSDLWDRVCQRDGARLVMLGTPNRGSFDIVETLVGTAPTLRQLALLDLVNSAKDIGNIVAQFPGVLELLPDPDKFLRQRPLAGLPRRNATSRPYPVTKRLQRCAHGPRQDRPTSFQASACRSRVLRRGRLATHGDRRRDRRRPRAAVGHDRGRWPGHLRVGRAAGSADVVPGRSARRPGFAHTELPRIDGVARDRYNHPFAVRPP